ncbi:MAG: RagB/SusD family nutrient uptake outer membrane protein, partial [Prevotellaceae bacterium]|nr:RagB/SusD family nutrient uptake outer membrane protein [Prevotellaceae bacterium]
MKKIYNILSVITVSFSLLFLSGCDLEEHPMSDLSPVGFYDTQKGIESLINGIYQSARDLDALSDNLRKMNALGTDTEEAAEGNRGNSMNWYGHTASEGTLNNAWNSLYALVNFCNYATKYIPIAEGMSDDDRKVREAEARFFRAYSYYHLTMHFGDVHFSLEASEGAATEAYRTPLATIWDEGIYPDLRFAAANLPPKAQNGRLTSWAGKFLLGFALLSDPRGTTTQW